MFRATIRLAWILAGILAVGLLPVCAGHAQAAPRIDEGIDWVVLDSIPFDSPDDAAWEGSARIEASEAGSHLVCDGLTQLFWEVSCTDARVELRVRLGSGGFGIAVRGGGSGEIEFGSQLGRYVLIRHPGAYLQDRNHNPQLDESHWYSVVFLAIGDQFTAEVDGNTWFVIEDDDPLLTPGRIRVVANPTDEPICLDEIRVSCPREELTIENLFPRVSEWNPVFEEPIEEGWNSSLLTSQLGSSDWDLLLDGDRTALQVTCNGWASLPSCYAWEDYAFISQVKIDHGGATLSYRAGDEGRYYVGLEDGTLFLGKEKPWGHRAILATSTSPIELGTWYNVAIFGIGSELAVRLNGELVIRYDDRSSPLLSGGISYETCGEDPVLLIDEIEILSNEAPIDPYALLSTAEALREEGDFQAAQETLEQAVELFRALVNRSGEAEALRLTGKTLVSSGNLSAAIGAFRQAIEVLAAIDDRASVAWCYLDLGDVHMRLEDLASAEECFARARDSFVLLSDREGEIEALRSEGRFLLALTEGFRRAGNRVEAISSLEKALRAFRDAGDEREEANALMWLASLYKEANRFAEAVDCAEQAEPLYRSIGDHFAVRGTLAIRLECYYYMGQFDLALEYGEKALDAHRRYGGDEGGEAATLDRLSNVHLARGEIERAIDYCLMAVSMYLEFGDMIGVAEKLLFLGNLYYEAGDAELATEFRRQSLDLMLNLDELSLAEGLRHVGEAHMSRGDLSAAIDSVEQALGIYRQFGSRGGEAMCLATLANYYMLAGRSQEALECAEEAVAIGQEADDPGIACSGLRCLSGIHMQLGQVGEAIEALEHGLEIAQDADVREVQIGLYQQLADLYQQLDRLEEGIGFLEQSMQIAQDVAALSTQIVLHRQLAGYYQDLARLDEARTHYELAIEGMERTFSGLETEALQESFFSRVRNLYVEYFMLLLEMEDVDETLWVAERCRARTYVEQVGRADMGLLDLLPEGGIRSGVISAEQVEHDAREAINNLPENTAAIEYFVTDGQTFVWVLRGGTIYGPRQVGVSKAELQRQVVEFRTSVEATDRGMSSLPDDEFLAMARDLYDLLISPVADWLGQIDHIVVVPSGPLYYLPFASLLECPDCVGIAFLGGEYLIERYSISYAPSLSTLHFVQQRQRVEQGEPNLLALADPASNDSTMPRLPEAQEEAQAIANLFYESDVLVDTAATEDALRQRVADAGHLLLSTHGSFDAGNPMYSYLMLTPTPTSDGRLHTYEVFELPLHADLVTLSACETLLPALEAARDTERVVRGLPEEAPIILSDEQLDELTTGDDVVGLTRAFLYAGSSSVLSTLWRVVSETTEPLMVAFYGYLNGGMSKAEALRQAQLDVMASYPHPRYWAAFELVGDWRAQW